MTKQIWTFDQFQAILRKAHKGEDPANRLYKKHLRAHKPHLIANRVHLSTEVVQVILEHWSTNDLVDLLPKGPSGKVPRHHTSDPVVIVRDRGVDSIIEGGRRISTWHREGIPGPHSVAILKVPQ